MSQKGEKRVAKEKKDSWMFLLSTKETHPPQHPYTPIPIPGDQEVQDQTVEGKCPVCHGPS